MITRSDKLSAEQVAARRRLFAIVAIVIAFALGYYLFARHGVAVRDAKRQPIQVEINRIEAAQREQERIKDRIIAAENAYNAANTIAGHVSDERHDMSLGNNSSDEGELALAQREGAAVETMSKRNDDEAAAFDKYANSIENVLGEGPVQKLRSDTQSYVTAYSVGLTDWEDAVSSTIDWYKLALRDGSSNPTDDIAHDYQLSAEGLSRAYVSGTQVHADMRHLESQVSARLHDAKMRLAAIH